MDRNHFWKDRKVLITGATGFVGSHLLVALLSLNANVTALVRDITSYRKKSVNQKVQLVEGDLGNFDVINRIVRENKIDTIFHLAAQSSVGYAKSKPIETFETNIRGTWNLLEACRINQVDSIILTSSERAYEVGKATILDENSPLNGKQPYDVSKCCADMIALSYYYTYNLPVSIVRCGNIFGGNDQNDTRLIPSIIRSMFLNQAPVIKSDGTPKHQYLYIEDLVEGYLLLAEKMKEYQLAGEAFNFCYEEPLTVLEVVQKIRKVMNSNVEPVILNETSFSNNVFMSSSKAKNTLRWKPSFTFESGIKKTITWYIDYFSKEDRSN